MHCPDARIVEIHDRERTAAQLFDLPVDRLGRVLLHETHHLLLHLGRSLIRDEPAGDLRHRFRREDGLRARTGPAGEQAVHFERGPRPGPLGRGIALLTPQSWDARLSKIVGFVVGQPGKIEALLLGDGAHAVVKTGQRDTSLVVVHLGNQFHQCLRRVVHRAAIQSRVQVRLWTPDVDLKICQSAQTIRDGRLVNAHHSRIRVEGDIRFEPLGVRAQERLQMS